MKVCSKCKCELPLSEFYKFSYSSDGHHSRCKTCGNRDHRAYCKANKDKIRNYLTANKDKIAKQKQVWCKANKEKIAEQKRIYRRANKNKIAERERVYRRVNKDKIAEREQAYYKANKDKKAKRGRAWRKANKAKIAELTRKQQKAHPDRYRAADHRRRAKKRGGITEKFSEIDIFSRDNWVCQICGKRISRRLKHPHPRSVSLDHIVPLSKRGSHTRKNVQAAHLCCNIRKHASRGAQLRLMG